MAQRHFALSWAAASTLMGAALAQDAALDSRINQALELARPALTDHLKAASKGTQRVGELALLVLAGIHDGIPVSDSALQSAIKKLAKAKPDQTYDIALRLIVMEACPTFPGRSKTAKEDAALLLNHRCDKGTFQYFKRPSTWDLSNTQYGALGLRAAAAMGIKISRRVWSKLAKTIGGHQLVDGGFAYAPRGTGATASMTVAGIAVLAICREALGDSHRDAKKLSSKLDRGWQWMAANKHTIGSIKEPWCFYYHYGLERAAILCDLKLVGGVTDWYAEGAAMLLDEQLSNGGWRSLKSGFGGHLLSGQRGQTVSTSFAILFLRRKFQKLVGPVTAQVVRLVNIGPASKQKDVDECARQLVKRGKEAMPDLLKALRSDVEPRRMAAAQALKQIAGEVFGFDARLDRDANRRAIRKAELWYLKNR